MNEFYLSRPFGKPSYKLHHSGSALKQRSPALPEIGSLVEKFDRLEGFEI